MSENIISWIVIMTNEMIIQRFSDVLLAAAYHYAAVWTSTAAILEIGKPVADATAAIRLNEGLPFGDNDL